MEINEITREIISAAIEVHRALGPGLLESACEACLAFELRARGLKKVERQQPLPLTYREVQLECGYRLDMLVEDQVIVEVKALENILPVHNAQLLSHLRLRDCRIGLLINSHVEVLRDGISRIANRYIELKTLSRRGRKREQRSQSLPPASSAFSLHPLR